MKYSDRTIKIRFYSHFSFAILCVFFLILLFFVFSRIKLISKTNRQFDEHYTYIGSNVTMYNTGQFNVITFAGMDPTSFDCNFRRCCTFIFKIKYRKKKIEWMKIKTEKFCFVLLHICCTRSQSQNMHSTNGENKILKLMFYVRFYDCYQFPRGNSILSHWQIDGTTHHKNKHFSY